MNVDRARDFSAKRRILEKWTSRSRQCAPRQVDMDFVRKYEERAPGHALGYKSSRSPDKPFSLGFFAQLDNFEPGQILPGIDPGIEERAIVRFHQLEAAIAVFLEPAIDIDQAIGKHSTLFLEALIDSGLRSRREVFDDHVSRHADSFVPEGT